jgi:hypothetical protein
MRIWSKYLATDKALKQQLLLAIDKMYYKTLRNQITGYATTTTLQILTHLYTAYGNITPANLADNNARLKAPCNPLQPIEVLFDQIENAIDIAAAAQAAYTQEQIVASAYNLVFQRGVFTDTCRDWRQLPFADKTWSNFKQDFAMAHQELRESQLTLQGAGYHAANSVQIQKYSTRHRQCLGKPSHCHGFQPQHPVTTFRHKQCPNNSARSSQCPPSNGTS